MCIYSPDIPQEMEMHIIKVEEVRQLPDDGSDSSQSRPLGMGSMASKPPCFEMQNGEYEATLLFIGD